MIRIVWTMEAFAHPTNPFTDRFEPVATWDCDCGASGEDDPGECPTCGCESRQVEGILPDSTPDFDPPDPYDPYELGEG